MKNYLKLIIALGLIASLFLLEKKQTNAAVRCETQYGGGQVCVSIGQLSVNKQVFDPDSKQFVDNLGLTSHHFLSGEEITFKLTVKNVGDSTINNISVTDTLPDFLSLTSGQLSYNINHLDPGQSDERQMKAKVVPKDQLPKDKTVLCLVNSLQAVSGDQSDKDSSQFCLERVGLPSFPPTGPKDWQWVLLGSLLTGIVGSYLVKISFNKSKI